MKYALPCQSLEDRRLLVVRIADAQIQHLVETSRPEQRLVKQVWSIRCADDEHTTASLLPVAHAIQLSKQLRDDSVHNAATIALISTLRRNGVQLVEEHDTRPCISRALKDAAHVRLGLTNVHVKQFWSFDGEEVDTELCSDCLG